MDAKNKKQIRKYSISYQKSNEALALSFLNDDAKKISSYCLSNDCLADSIPYISRCEQCKKFQICDIKNLCFMVVEDLSREAQSKLRKNGFKVKSYVPKKIKIKYHKKGTFFGYLFLSFNDQYSLHTLEQDIKNTIKELLGEKIIFEHIENVARHIHYPEYDISIRNVPKSVVNFLIKMKKENCGHVTLKFGKKQNNCNLDFKLEEVEHSEVKVL